MTTHIATYSPEDDKLRLYPAHRLDAEDYARVKAAGFRWAPRQELFFVVWTPHAEDLAIEFAGEIDDEDKSLVERAEERAERFDDYSASRKADAQRAQKAVADIADNIPLGQPILVGHHSERHARRDQQRIEDGMRRTIKMWETSTYWTDRAAGALRNAKYKERTDVRARRIKGLEADHRRFTKQTTDRTHFLEVWRTVARLDNDSEEAMKAAIAISNFDHCSMCFPLAVYPRDPPASQYEGDMGMWSALTGGVITPAQAADLCIRSHERGNAHRERWLTHLAHRIAYERAMLGEAGGLKAEGFDILPGGRVQIKGAWVVVLRVNHKDGKVVSVSTSGRFGRVRGAEEVQDYREPDAAGIAMVKAATAIPPLANFPGEGFQEMTAAEWKRKPADYRITKTMAATAEHGAYRYRSAFVPGGSFRTAQVYITDMKRADRPAAIGCESSEPIMVENPPVEPASVVIPPTEPEPWVPPVGYDPAERPADPEGMPDLAAMKAALKAGVKVAVVPQLFPTPPALAARMVLEADIRPGHRVLEPSAGTGNLIAAAIEAEAQCSVFAVEINHELVFDLRRRFPIGRVIVHPSDFLTYYDPQRTKYDRIIMNPPFKDGADIRHIAHALQFLADGGRLVAICANGPRQAAKLQPLAATWEELPEGTFADQGTNVRTVLLTIEGLPQRAAARPATEAPTKPVDLLSMMGG